MHVGVVRPPPFNLRRFEAELAADMKELGVLLNREPDRILVTPPPAEVVERVRNATRRTLDRSCQIAQALAEKEVQVARRFARDRGVQYIIDRGAFAAAQYELALAKKEIAQLKSDLRAISIL